MEEKIRGKSEVVEPSTVLPLPIYYIKSTLKSKLKGNVTKEVKL